MNVLLIGPPGSGKGTQGERLAKRLGIEHIAAGDLLRAEVEAGTPLGEKVRDYLDRGELVPDELVTELVLPRVQAAARNGGYLLDGYPRSVGQAREARRLAEEEGFSADAAIYLDAPREELIARLLARARIEGRSDDTRDVICNRLAVFDEATAPLIDYYRSRGLLRVVDASRSADEVTEAILAELRG
ncbi:MAG TPA: adenylate kinase [Jatrophihabitantaceae bacterium]|nr:adenylate kinase [Jatrophihabitantaceae bacterium]